MTDERSDGAGNSSVNLDPVDDDYLSRNCTPRAEIVSGLIREGQLVAFAGPFGVGKSPVLADLAIHVLNGIPWCGHEISRRPVIAIDFESDGPGFKKRVVDISGRLGVPRPIVPDHFDIYLNHDSAEEPTTSRLLEALAARGFERRVALIAEALERKPDALVIIDPIELLFRFDTRDKTHVLVVYGVLRQLLSKYSKAAILSTFNLRKKDRRSVHNANLLSDPRGWLEEICGSLDLLNRSDVRLGLDFYDEEVRVINGIRRGEPMDPTLIRPASLANGHPAGFELCPPSALSQEFAFTKKQLEYWRKLPPSFSFDSVADQLVPRSTLSRTLARAKSLGLIAERDAVWTKVDQG